MAPRPEPTHPALRLALRLPRQGIMPRHHAKAITPDLRLGQLPDWLQEIAQPVFENAVHHDTGQPLFERVPEQCMVWEQSATNESKSKAGPRFSPSARTITSAATFRTTRN